MALAAFSMRSTLARRIPPRLCCIASASGLTGRILPRAPRRRLRHQGISAGATVVQPTVKVSPEQVFSYRARRPTGLFVYGRRGSMHHDLHFRLPGGSSYNVYAYHKSEYRNGRSNGSSAEEHAVLPGRGRKGRHRMANSQ